MTAVTIAQAIMMVRRTIAEITAAVRQGDKDRALEGLQQLDAMILAIQGAAAERFGTATVHAARGALSGLLDWAERKRWK